MITDRYVDSTLAYQGAGRDLADGEVERVARWATARPAPAPDRRARPRAAAGADPLRGAATASRPRPLEFHERVREMFLQLAAAAPEHYLVVDARLPGRGDRGARSATGSSRCSARPAGQRAHGDSMTTTDDVRGVGRAWSARATPSRRCSGRSPGTGMTHAWLFTGPPGLGSLQRGDRVRRGPAVRARHRLRRVPRLPHRAGRLPPRRQRDPHRDLGALHRRHARAGASSGACARSSGSCQVMIIEDADRLDDAVTTPAPRNALLKAIEEPTPKTVWLLCAPTVEDVLPTISSRCRNVVARDAHRRGGGAVPGGARRRRRERRRLRGPRQPGTHRPGPGAGARTRRRATGATRWSRSRRASPRSAPA